MTPDYFMRIIEQLGAMLAKLTAFQRAGEHAQAQGELERLCQQHAGMSLAELKGSSPEAVAARLQDGGGRRYPRAVLLAEVLVRDAQVREAAGGPAAALPGYVHAFCLLADSVGVFSLEEQAFLRPKVQALAHRLSGLRTHPYLAERLRRHDPDAAA